MHDCNACAAQIDCLISSRDTAGICSSQVMCLDNSVSVSMSPESHHSFSLLRWWLLVEVCSKTETSIYLTTRCFPDIQFQFYLWRKSGVCSQRCTAPWKSICSFLRAIVAYILHLIPAWMIQATHLQSHLNRHIHKCLHQHLFQMHSFTWPRT